MTVNYQNKNTKIVYDSRASKLPEYTNETQCKSIALKCSET